MRLLRSLAALKKTRIVMTVLVAVTLVPVEKASADPMRDFVVSCSYGVLAGTLVGAATLAFSDKPGDNLNKVARGASLGLYAGILLGAYVIYGGGPGEDEDAAAALNRTSTDGLRLPTLAARESSSATQAKSARNLAALSRVQVFPLIGDRGLEGGAAQVRLLEF